jgi:hypothetical protein
MQSENRPQAVCVCAGPFSMPFNLDILCLTHENLEESTTLPVETGLPAQPKNK